MSLLLKALDWFVQSRVSQLFELSYLESLK